MCAENTWIKALPEQGNGRVRLITDRDQNYSTRIFCGNRQATLNQIISIYNAGGIKRISSWLIQRSLLSIRYGSRKSARLTPVNVITPDIAPHLFSWRRQLNPREVTMYFNESRFQILWTDGRIRVWQMSTMFRANGSNCIVVWTVFMPKPDSASWLFAPLNELHVHQEHWIIPTG